VIALHGDGLEGAGEPGKTIAAFAKSLRNRAWQQLTPALAVTLSDCAVTRQVSNIEISACPQSRLQHPFMALM
jgi:hypothetical protein